MDIEEVRERIRIDPFNPKLYTYLAWSYLEGGEEGLARDVALKRRNMPSDDPFVHRRWADVFEELGMARQARECYQQALKLDPSNSETLYRFAVLLSDIGDYEKSLHHLRKALKNDPEHQAAKKLLAHNYRELGFDGQAEALSPKREEKPAQSGPRWFLPSISKKQASRFLALFSGREIGYAVQEVDPKAGELSYHFVEAPLTPDLAVSHLKGELTLAVYPLRSDNTVRYAAVSVTIPNRVRQENIRNRGYLVYLEEKTREYALSFKIFASSLGIPSYPEDTGAGDHRVWLFFSEQMHFLKVKRFITLLMERAPRADTKLHVHPVLATKPVGIGWVENPVVLPMGIQRHTLRRSLFLDNEGTPYPEQLKLLKKIREIDLSTATRVIRKHRLPPSRSGSPRERSALSPLVQRLVDQCEVVREIVQKAVAGKVLLQEEKIILFYTVGLVDKYGESLHHILEPCPDYDYEKVHSQTKRLHPNPISCLRIREKMPELTSSVGCNCNFDLSGGKYPSPVLHVMPHLVPVSEEFQPPTGGLPALEAAKRYVNLRRHQEETATAIARLESILDKHFLCRGIESMKVGKIRLHRHTAGGEVNWELEAG